MAFYYDKDGYRVEIPSTASPAGNTPQYYYDSEGYRVQMPTNNTSTVSMPEYYYDKDGYRVDIPSTADVDSLYSKYNELVNGYSQRYSQTGYRADYADWKTNTNNSTREMSDLSAKIRRNLDTYRSVYGDEYADSVLQLIDGIDGGLVSLNEAAENEYAIFSQFATEEDYNNAVAAYEEEQRLLNYDVAAAEAQIKTLQENLARVNELFDDRWYWMQAHNDEKVAEVEKELAALSLATDKPVDQAIQNIPERYNREIDRLQKEIDLAKSTQNVVDWNSIGDPSSEFYDPDFEKYVARGFETKNEPKKVRYDNSSQEFVSAKDKGIQNPAAFVRNGGRIGVTNTDGDFKLSDDAKRYLAMSDEEFEMYNYFLGKYGKNRAEEYVDWIEKSAYSLTARVASKEFEEILQGNRVLEYLYGVTAGLDQFGTGIKNLFSNKDYYRPSVTQYKSSYVREDLKNSGPQVAGVSLGQIAYDVTTTSSAMMPSVLTSAFVGSINPVAGQVVGSAVMGASASGNAYAEMVNLGYSKGQARTYSLLVGASEATLQYLLGGVGKLGGKLSSGVTKSLVSKLDDVLAKVAIKYGDDVAKVLQKGTAATVGFAGDAISEGLEESLQEIIDPIFRAVALDDYNAEVDWEEALYSGILGVLTSAGMNASSVAYNKVSQAVDTAKANALTKNEKIVLEGVVEKRIAELEANGEKLASAQKKEIEKQVRQELDDGDISISDIEEVLGDKWEQTGEDDRRIVSSYAQELEKTRAFSADVSNYTEKQKAIVRSAIDSGVLNNTNRTHKFVDFVAKVAEKMGVEVDFVNNEALKKSGFAIEGKDVAGYLNGNKMALNVDSSKALNTVVGHEVMHILQDAGLDGKVKELVKQYAEMKGEWNSRLESTTELYSGISEDAEGELVCDLIGDYLFTDSRFIEMLAAEHQSVFQRLWNDIKRLCKLATAGSKEAKALAKVEKAFVDAYRKAEKAQKNTATKSDGVRYSIVESVTDTNGNVYKNVVKVNTNIFSGYNSRNWKTPLKKFIDEQLVGTKIPLLDKDGGVVVVEFAKPNERVTAQSGNRRKVLDKLKQKNDRNSQIVIANIEEIVEVSFVDETVGHSQENKHQWLDEKGWDFRFSYFETPNGKIYSVQLNIANTADGRFILYDVNKINEVGLDTVLAESSAASQKTNSINNIIPNSSQDVKQRQLEIINQYNPAPNSYNTWIRTVDDIKTFEEALNDEDYSGYDEFTPDYTRKMAEKAVENGEVTVYSSYPIKQGVFVTPSKMEALSYSGNGKVYSKKVSLDSVAWIDPLQGQYAEVKYSISSENQKAVGDYNVYGRDEKLSKDSDVAFESSAKRAATKEDLQAGFDFIINGMQDPASYESVEEERREAFDAITDVDEVGENRGVYEDGTSKESVKVINDRDLSYVTNILKDTLHLNSRQVGEIKKIIREYSIQENPNKDDLYRRIEERFGTVEFADKIEEIATVKSELRGRKIKVSEAIKNDITDYDAFRKSHYRKLTLSDEGIPVDSLYMELSNNYGSLFPEDIVNPSDQLQRIAEVVDMDSYNRGEYEYDADVIQKAVDVIDAGVKRYAKEAKSDVPLTVEQQVANRREDINTYIESDKRERNRRFADYSQQIDNLIAEYEALEDYNSKEAIALQYRIQELKKQRSIDDERFAEKLERHQKSLARVEDGTYATAKRRQSKQEELFTWAKNLLGDTSTWKDKKHGIFYKVNTLHRNLRDIVRDKNGKADYKKADEIYDATAGTYNHNEALLNRESARIKKQFADMKINPVESEYIQMLGEFRHNPETTLEEQDVMNFYEKNYKKIDEQKVEKAIELARKVYDDLFERVNEVLREQGMKEIPYRKGYFPHFVEEKQGPLAKFFNWKADNNRIPDDVIGITETFKPSRSWQSFNKQREGDTTDYDFLKGLDRYIQGSLDWIYHIEDIQKRRAIENYIRYTHSEKGVQERIDEIEQSDTYNADEAEAQRNLVFAEAENSIGNFLNDFRTQTNTLAGKKSTLDRDVEELANRQMYSTMKNISGRVTANMVAGSVSSALTNFIPITQSWMQVSPKSTLVAMAETIRNVKRDDGTIEKSDFLTNRLRPSEKLDKRTWDKIVDKAGIMMEVVDNFSAQTIWRSKYNENIQKGMSEVEAIKNADEFSENVMAGRSRGNAPTLFDAKNPVVKIFTAFQLEVNNQYGYMFKDAPRDLKSEGIGKLVKGYATMFIGAYVFNALYSSLVGRDSAFDPIGIVEDLLRDIGAGDEDEKEDSVGGVVNNLIDNVIDELPFVSSVAGGGRIPISSMLPYGDVVSTVKETINDIEAGAWERLGAEWLNPVYYLGLPVGGGQIRKTVQGLSMYNTNGDRPIAGSYTDDGALRFPVESDPLSVAQAILFGQYSSSTAREYFDEGRSPLSDKQLEEFVAMGEDMTIREYWDYLDEISAINKARANDKTVNAIKMKVEYINSLDLPLPKKNILVNNILNRKDPVDLQGFDELSGFAEWDFSMKNPEKYQFFKDNGVAYQLYASSEDIKEVYDSDYQWYKRNPEKVVVAGAVADTVVEYREIKRGLDAVKGEVYEKTGKTVSGSLKENRLEYINNLDISYGAKLILYKDLYPGDNDFNMEIIEYLTEREDISYDDMFIILDELGFKVNAKTGKVTW